MTGNEIAARMNDAGVPPARGKRWVRHTIFGILKNKGLRGRASWNGIPLLPEASPAIFTEEEGREIDGILALDIERARRTAKEAYERSGPVFCECGTSLGLRTGRAADLYLLQVPQVAAAT
jgi:hypothetical protein